LCIDFELSLGTLWTILEQEIRRADFDIRFVNLFLSLAETPSNVAHLIEVLEVKQKGIELIIQNGGDDAVLRSAEHSQILDSKGFVGVNPSTVEEVKKAREIFGKLPRVVMEQ
jgi:hypothetical protein